jgi:hypothetical protein
MGVKHGSSYCIGIFDNIVVRRIFQRDEIIDDYRKLHKEPLY